MTQAKAEPVRLPRAHTQAPQGLELRHLRYLAAVADAGTFTRAAEQMPSAPHDLSISAARADALFASPLQRSDEPNVRQVERAIATAIGVHGAQGCAARVAQAYGEHPETALIRMRWALTAVAGAFGGSRAEPTHAPAPGHSTMPATFRAA